MKKVLILEDEVNIRSFVVINLKRAGYDAIEAGTGQEALDRLRDHPDIGVAKMCIRDRGGTALPAGQAAEPGPRAGLDLQGSILVCHRNAHG